MVDRLAGVLTLLCWASLAPSKDVFQKRMVSNQTDLEQTGSKEKSLLSTSHFPGFGSQVTSIAADKGRSTQMKEEVKEGLSSLSFPLNMADLLRNLPPIFLARSCLVSQ